MVATSHPASTLTAVEFLKHGGNAVDAAIAAAAVQAVVEPHSTGIGGDCFVLYAPCGTNQIVGLNGSGRAPRRATTVWYREQGIDRIELGSPHAVTVPGAVDAWATLLADHGTRSLAEVLEPAIEYAEYGYVVHPRSASDWKDNVDRLRVDESSARIFLPAGRSPVAREVLRQPELAGTFRIIALDPNAAAEYTSMTTSATAISNGSPAYGMRRLGLAKRDLSKRPIGRCKPCRAITPLAARRRNQL